MGKMHYSMLITTKTSLLFSNTIVLHGKLLLKCVCGGLVLLVEVLDAVDVVGGVHSERDAVQAPVTHNAGKAVRVVSFTCRPQNTLHDWLTADVTGLQGVLKTYKHTHSIDIHCYR